MWLWTLRNDSAYSSLFVNQTSHHSRAHVTSVCFWQPIWEVVCLWADSRCNLWTCTPTTPVYHWLIWQLEFTNLDWVDSGPSEELWMMKSCIITWFLSMRLVRWEDNQSTTSINLLITKDWGWCNQVSRLWWMPGCMVIQVWLWLVNLHLRLVFISFNMIYKHYIQKDINKRILIKKSP